jgi:WD40 repeat protein
VYSAHYPPLGQCFVSAGRDRTARVWNPTSSVERLRLVHAGEVRSARFSPDGTRVLTACSDGTARIWDGVTGINLVTVQHDSAVVLGEFNADGGRFVTASLDATARIWEAATGRLLHTLRHDAELHDVHSIQFSPDSSRVVTVTRNTVKIWDARTGAALTGALDHPAGVNSAKFSPDGNRIVSACQDGVARIWNVERGQIGAEPLYHDKAVAYAEFSPDGKWIVTASFDGSARVWESMVASGPVPTWLPELAEAVAGQRLRGEAQTERVSLDALWQFKHRFATTRASASDHYTRWACWLFTETAARPVTLSSPLSLTQVVRAEVEENTSRSLEKAVSLTPNHAIAEARLALHALTNAAEPSKRQMDAADWQTARAVARGPVEAETLWARADVCERLGRFSEAFQTMERPVV